MVGAMKKFQTLGADLYDYRFVFQNHVVFDVGDHGDWPRAVQEATAIHKTLRAMEVPHWVALSGGKGIHIEVFGPPDANGEWRSRFAAEVTQRASPGAFPIEVDPCTINPLGEESRAIRDFGGLKDNGRKILWWQDGQIWWDLPTDVKTAYRRAEKRGFRYPKIRIDDSLPRCDTSWMKELFGDHCPKSPLCSNRKPEQWLGCDSCPMVAA